MSAQKNIKIGLTFTADTAQAKAQLQQLQSTLSNLSSGTNVTTGLGGMTTQIQNAIQAASQLSIQLKNATNVDTGRLDLGKFNQQLKSSGMTLQSYATQLTKLGPQGAQAFVQLARSISQAENPMMRLSAGIKKLGTTFMNTMRWQISSSVLNGLISGVQTAYQYAQDLNESLNNIRIVTGLSSEEMDKFAARANKAAKALSASTLEFTDAALIYYQQGLVGEAVDHRAETTVKMANVTKQSVEEVSDQLTAIWNNFYNGTKSLEYYADVVTALGAATASSSDEIAQGLEKFASVGETVGLSYEYATAALATVTATTRQSADVVGTAFKTLFARMQDLKLGETLEDGTTLGQYSAAMATVGVNIKNAAGELKDMDQILDELGIRWKTLDRDQQVALAKSVAGLRQYNQFISLMANYDYFKENVGVAENSTGELQRQQDIYAESWEAASERVAAAAESIYTKLLNDDFFIELLNGLEDVIGFVDDLIDAFNGLPGILNLITAILLNKFGPALASGLQKGVEGAKELFTFAKGAIKGQTSEQMLAAQKQAKTQEALQLAKDGIMMTTPGKAGEITITQLEREIELTQLLVNNKSKMTDLEYQTAEMRIQNIGKLEEEETRLAAETAELEKQVALTKEKFQSSGLVKPTNYAHDPKGPTNATGSAFEDLQKFSQAKGKAQAIREGLAQATTNTMFGSKEDIETLRAQITDAGESVGVQGGVNRAKAMKSLADLEGYADSKTGELPTKLSENWEQYQAAVEKAKAANQAFLSEVVNAAEKGVSATETAIRSANEYVNEEDRQKALEGFEKELTSENAKHSNLTKEINKEKEKLKSIDDKDSDEYKQIAEKVKGLEAERKAIINNKNAIKDKIKTTKDEIANGKKHNKTIDESIKNLKDNNEALGKNSLAVDKNKKNLQQSESAIKKFINGIKGVKTSWADVFVGVASGISSISMGVQSLVGAFDQIKSMSKDGFSFSGFLSVLTSLGMALPMVVSGIRNMTDAVAKSNIIETVSLALTKSKYNEETKMFVIRGKQLTQEALGQALEKAGVTQDQISIIISKLKSGATLTEAFAEAKLNQEKIKAIALNLGLQASMGVILLIILAVVAAATLLIAGMVALGKAISNWYNADKLAAEEAKKHANEVAEAYNKVKEAYDQLKESIEKYRNAQDAISKLKEGTKEWADAIQDANQQVIDLIAKYPQLASAVTVKGTQSIIDDQTLSELLNAEEAQVNAMQYRKQQTSLEAQKADNKYKRTQLIRDELDTYKFGDWLAEYTTNSLKTVITSLVSPTAASTSSAYNNSINGLVRNSQEAKESEDALNKLEALYKEQGNAIFADFDSTLERISADKELTKALKDNKKAVQELIASNKALEEAEKAMALTNINSKVTGQEHFANLNYGTGVQEALLKRQQQAEESTRIANKGIKGKTAEALLEEWADITGAGDVDFRRVKVKGKNKIMYDTSTEEKLVVSVQEVIDTVSAYRAELAFTAAEAANLANELGSYIGALERSDDATDQIMANLLEYGDLSHLPVELAKSFANVDLASFIKENEEAIKKFGITAEEFEKLYIESLANYDPIIAQQNILIEKWEKINSLVAQAAEELEMSGSAIESYAQHLISLNEALEGNEEAAVKAAASQFHLAKGIVELRKEVQSYAAIAKDDTENQFERAEAYGKLKDAFDKTFSTDVSLRFIEDNLSLIEEMVYGSVEALEELRSKLVFEQIDNFDTITDQQKESLKAQFEKLIEEASVNEIGMEINLDDTEAIKSLNHLLRQGELTQTELESMFANSGLQMTDSIQLYKMPQTTESTSVSTWEDPSTHEPVTQVSKTRTTNWVTMPWIGDNPPQFQEITKDDWGNASEGQDTGGDALRVAYRKEKGLTDDAKVSMTDLEAAYGGIGGYYQLASSGLDSSSAIKAAVATSDAYDVNEDILKYSGLSGSGKDEDDRYHYLDEQLSDIEEVLSRIETIKDRVFGNAQVEAFSQSISALNDKLTVQKDKLQAIETNLEMDKLKASAAGVTFDENGLVSNWDQLNETQKQFAEKYEGTLNLLQSENTKLLELEYELVDEYLAEVEARFEGMAETVERTLDLVEWQIGHIENTGYDAAKGIKLLSDSLVESVENFGTLKQEATESLDAIMTGINDAKGKKIFSAEEIVNIRDSLLNNTFDPASLTEEQRNALAANGGKIKEILLNYEDGWKNNIDKIAELKEQMQEMVASSFAYWNDELQRNISLMEHQQNVLDNYANLEDLLGKKYLRKTLEGDTLQDYLAQTSIQENLKDAYLESAKAQLIAAKETNDANKLALKTAKDALAQGLITQEQYNEMEQTARDAEAAFMEAWVNSLEVAAEQFESNVERILNAFDEALGKIEEMQEAFDRQKTLNDFYLKDYEKTYEIGKLNRQINASIDKNMNMSLRHQRQLNDLSEELLAYQAEGKEMSDYDLGYLQKKYELTLAQIALEEAQNSKSQVRLTKDSQGNYGYIYTADQNAVNKAEETLEKAKYDLEKFMEDSQETISSYYFELLNEMKEAIAAIDPNDPEYKSKVDAIKEYYSKLMNSNLEELEELLDRSGELNHEFNTQITKDFKETIIGQLYPELEKVSDLTSKTTGLMNDMIEAVKSAYSGYSGTITEMLSAAGESVGGLQTKFETAIGKTEDEGIRKSLKGLSTDVQTVAADFNSDKKDSNSFKQAVGAAEKAATDADTAFGNLGEEITTLLGVTDPFDISEMVNQFSGEGGLTSAIEGSIEKIGELQIKIAELEGKQKLTSTQKELLAEALAVTADAGYNKGGVSVEDLTAEDWETVAGSKYFEEMVQSRLAGDTTPLDYRYAKEITENLSAGTRAKIRGETDSTSYHGDSTGSEYQAGDGLSEQELNSQKHQALLASGYQPGPFATLSSMNYKGKKIQYIVYDGQRYQVLESQDFNGKTYYKISETPLVQYEATQEMVGPQTMKKDVKPSTDWVLYTIGQDGADLYIKSTDFYQGSDSKWRPNQNTPLYAKRFDTGGYTGSWGPEGRLAMLHQKELVLNAHDTENLLSAVQMIRSIVEKVELNAIAQRYTNLLSGLSSRVAQQIAPAGTLDQNVHIEAHFPNATDHSQIEEAFGNIVNLAAQYANRK